MVPGLDAQTPAPKKVRSAAAEAEGIAGNTRELLEDAVTALYWIPAQVTGLPGWELNATEARLLAERGEAFFKSLGKARSDRLIKVMDKFMPGASLAITALIITMPRVKMTQAARAASGQTSRLDSVTSSEASRTGSVREPAAGYSPTYSAAEPVADSGEGAPAVSERPITAADIVKLGGSDAE